MIRAILRLYPPPFHLQMGIKNLSKLISDHAKSAVREQEMKSFFNRKVAVDASMSSTKAHPVRFSLPLMLPLVWDWGLGISPLSPLQFFIATIALCFILLYSLS